MAIHVTISKAQGTPQKKTIRAKNGKDAALLVKVALANRRNA